MFQLFQNFATPEQQEMANLIKSKGGDAALQDDKVVKELMEREAQLSPGAPETRHKKPPKPISPNEIRREIKEDPDLAIKRNAKLFDAKFDMQRRLISEDIDRTVRRETDRVISAVTGGPHDRIIDLVRLMLSRVCYYSLFIMHFRIYIISGRKWYVSCISCIQFHLIIFLRAGEAL